MSTVSSRTLVVSSSLLFLLGVAGCTADSAESPEEPRSALANLNPCSIMTPEQLSSEGFQTPGEKIEQYESEPGCSFSNGADGMRVSLFKNQEETVDSYRQSGRFDEFTMIDVNDRSGAQAVSAGAAATGVCTTMLPAGGGVVLVDAIPNDPSASFDGCEESLKIAKQVEPNLPE